MKDDFGACVVLIPYPDDLPISPLEGGHHISLVYFGDTPLPKNLMDELVITVAGLSQDYAEGQTVATKGVEYFGEDGDHVVLTVDDSASSIPVTIRDDLLDMLGPELMDIFGEAQNFPEFKPHITLGRKSKGFVLGDTQLPSAISVWKIGVWNGGVRIEMDLNGSDEAAQIHMDEVFNGDDELAHEGVLRKSGRYPWGSGQNPHQRNREFKDYIKDLEEKGLSNKEIAQAIGLRSDNDLRNLKTRFSNAARADHQSQAQRLHDAGNSNVAIGREMGINESQVRSLLDPVKQMRARELETLATKLREEVKEKKHVDVGAGTELHLGVSATKLQAAVSILTDDGYRLDKVKTPNPSGKDTVIKVLSPSDVSFKEVVANKGLIQPAGIRSEDRGMSFSKWRTPTAVDPKKVAVRFGDEGGADMDGVIELRRGVADLSLGSKRYAQVRIQVGDEKYLKGMAVYADDLPDGVNIRFNTNKSRAEMVKASADGKGKTPEQSAMKNLEKDPERPFGSSIKPGGQRGALNIVGEEGDWHEWSDRLSSQMLSKQTPQLATQQLDLKYRIMKSEFDEINALTNPTLKKKLLDSFADGADSDAAHLRAAALPRQGNHVILPLTQIKETEIYAPNYKNGEKVVLIRHPHGGIFEIPELTVNNRNAQGKRLLEDARDAVGIHPNVAERLSGADFDGDTVLVIPNNRTGPLSVKTSPALPDLKGFNPREAYPKYEGMPLLDGPRKQTLMGVASNLITDMTIKDANQAEIARAVKYSMVVIDAEKHQLNHKQARADFGISQLKAKYQLRENENGFSRGASTIVSRSKSPIVVPERKDREAKAGGPIDPVTGRRMYQPTGNSYVNKEGKTIIKTSKVKAMDFVDDAHSLSSGTVIESVYADHANRVKGLANQARREMLMTPNLAQNKSAARVYAPQVESLKNKLRIAEMNAPLERRAQLVANAAVSAKRQANPNLEKDQIRKLKAREQEIARTRFGAKKERITILPDEWEAIQNGAVSDNLLRKVLNNSDLDKIKELATPRTSKQVPSAKLALAKALLRSGYSNAEVAERLGVPTSTLNDALVADSKED